MRIKSIFILLALPLAGYAQQKQYTIAEATLGIYTNLAPADIKQLSWIPGEESLSSVVKGEILIKQYLPGLTTDTILRLNELNEQLQNRYIFRNMPVVDWLDNKTFLLAKGTQYFMVSRGERGWGTRLWRELPEGAENEDVNKQTRQIAYTKDNNLFLLDASGKTHAITNDTDGGIVNGQSVHRQEFGIDRGIFFSPKGNYLAFYRMDQRMVEDYPLIQWDQVPATVHYTKYPFAGRTSHEVTLGVYNPKTGQTIFLETGTPKDHYLTCVTWSPDEQYIFIAILNREQDHLWLNKYDAQTGKLVKTLFEETDPQYVHPQHALYFLPDNNDQFIWWSQRDGFMHLYRYNTGGKLLNQVTKGDWVVNDISGFNAAKKTLYIIAAKESPMEKHLYSVNYENGKLALLDNSAGVHTVKVSSSGNYVTDRWSNATTPRNIEVYSTDKKWKETLLKSPDPLAEYERPRIEQITLKANDNTPLYGKLIYPTGFDSTKQYPVIVYLYNGPGVQLLSNSFPFSGNLWYEYMAQHGYIVFTMDGRGSSNRGVKFEHATFRQLGTVEMDDQLKGVEFLKSRSFVDSTRMGIHGWSFGGFMTTSFMLRKPGVFACGVAGGPVMDWKMYEVMYTERYMDTPQENPEGYENANLLTKAGNLKGKLLLIHGTIDSTVVWQHSIKFLKAAVDKKAQVDYFVYPGYEHNVRGYDRIHLMQKVSDYFDLYLKIQK
ncbi:dipeptidyl-peptidase-4 [Chitinophaga sp. YR573]|uniref:S9 family peptidase n=1 Tax=Chitinophaga sp. YR573 TaxID=1881040 RepID=UPI0008D66003|nr:DPP IV N-terminal domain-containing protein [Chitinophaga sp. YR573]SEW34822.1 dipeptidyl-peptidase-4 [Chitinophaga sp. YR573]